MQRCVGFLTRRLSCNWKLPVQINRGFRVSCAVHAFTRRGAYEKEALVIAEKSKDVQADYDRIFSHEEIVKLREAGKDREAFFLAIELYLARHSVTRRGHVEFIEVCMRNLEAFKVHRDLDVYKRLLDVFPPDELRATTFWQFEFKHYPKQQDCAIDLLEKMHFADVIPDDEVGRKLVRIFGRHSYAVRRFQRQMYWLPKFANADPYFVPNDLLAKYPHVDSAYIALAALRRASPDNNVQLYLHRFLSAQSHSDSTGENGEKPSLEKDTEGTPFVAYAQSAEQRAILEQFARYVSDSATKQTAASSDDDVTKREAKTDAASSDDKGKLNPLFVDGAFTLWFQQTRLRYYTLSCAPSTRKLEKWALLNRAPNDYSQPVKDTFAWTTVFNVSDRLEEAQQGVRLESGSKSQPKQDQSTGSPGGSTPLQKDAKKTEEFSFDQRQNTPRYTLDSAVRPHADPFDEKLSNSVKQSLLRNVQEIPTERVAQLFPQYTPSVHEQPEMTILAMCILDDTSSASVDSSRTRLTNWIKLLEAQNPSLRNLHVVFRLNDVVDEDDVGPKADVSALSTDERSSKLDEREWRS